ncbi:MAG: hypothetical protein LCH95_07175 [Proteobacteria bacterium]|nr:hypothetical protein [Pseudomonadota bacterium]
MTIQSTSDGSAWPQCEVEFPKYPLEDLPPIPDGFIDASRRYDACPSCRSDQLQLQVHIDWAVRDRRQSPSAPRFVVTRVGKNNGFVDLECEHWEQVANLVDMYRRYEMPAVRFDWPMVTNACPAFPLAELPDMPFGFVDTSRQSSPVPSATSQWFNLRLYVTARDSGNRSYYASRFELFSTLNHRQLLASGEQWSVIRDAIEEVRATSPLRLAHPVWTSVAGAFPDFDLRDLPEMPLGFLDTSRPDEGCPSATNKLMGLKLFVDWPEPRQRQEWPCPRFSLYRNDRPEGQPAACSDCWSVILSTIEVIRLERSGRLARRLPRR